MQLASISSRTVRKRTNVEKFNRVIKLGVRDSVPTKPFELKKPPEGAPNVLIVLYDDTGLAAWSPYGGRINIPTMGPARRQRRHPHPVAHHRAVLADPLDVLTGPQPPREPVRVGRGEFDGLSRRAASQRRRCATIRPGAAGQRAATMAQRTTTSRSTSPGGQPPPEWPLSRASTGSTFLGGRPTSGIRT